jgi:arylsulfatase
MKKRNFATALLASAPSLLSAQQAPPPPTRTAPPRDNVVLPRPDFHFHGNVGRTLAESDPPQFPQMVRPPAGAPNIVIILIDDAGYGQFGTFGGQTPTPGLDSLAAQGLRYTRFHTTALCSPTRAALLTGRNHHVAGTGVITEMATGYDGYTGLIPRSVGTIAQVLNQYGYATAWFGKNHNTPDWETSQNGPFDHWPSGLGFDYFYGFMGGDMDQWEPVLYENHNLVPRSTDPNYILNTDLSNHAISWLRRVRSIDPSKPYLLYMATGATHAPHHAPADWIAKFRGQFDQGWDVYRQQTLDRQKRLGVVPANTELTPRPASLPAWESLSADQKRLFARMMEVFAAFTAQTDYEMGRLLDAIRGQPDADNTLIFYIVGDNGSSGEGGLVGLVNENSIINNVPEALADNLTHIDELGGYRHYNHFPAAWAHAMDTPFQWTKQVASHLGGVRNPMVVSWPARIHDRGGVRSQFGHVIDIAPTIYEAVGIQMPTELNGTAQKAIEGVSMAYSFDSAQAMGRHRTQYFELFLNRGIYSDGWWAASMATVPWDVVPAPINPDTMPWELYNLDQDFSQAHNLAAQEPRRLRQLQDLWWAQASLYNVLPLDPRKAERLNAEVQGRPSPTAGRTTFTYYPGVTALPGSNAPNPLNKSWSVTADIEVARSANGVLWDIGGLDGGFSLYVRNGKPVFSGNYLGRSYTRATSTRPLPTGHVVLRGEFAYDGGGNGKGATLSLFVNEQKVGEARMPATLPFALGLGPTMDVGIDTGSPADEAYQAQMPFAFTGTINSVTIQLRPQPAH